MASLKLLGADGKPDPNFRVSFRDICPFGLSEGDIPEGHTLVLFECFGGAPQIAAANQGEAFFNLGAAKARVSPDRIHCGDSFYYRAELRMESANLKDFVLLYEQVMEYLNCMAFHLTPRPPESFVRGIANDLHALRCLIASIPARVKTWKAKYRAEHIQKTGLPY